MYTNTALFICAIISLLLVYRLVRGEGLKENHDRYLFLMGLFVALWSLGHGLMGFSEDFSKAHIFRDVAFAGVVGGLVCEAFFMASQAGVAKYTQILMHIFLVGLGTVDAIFMSAPNADTYVRVGSRTAYYTNGGTAQIVHTIFIGTIVALLICMWFVWRKNNKYQREKHYMTMLFASNIVLLLGCVPDTFLPRMGYASYPSSAMGASVTYWLLLFVASRYNAFRLTNKNMEHFVFDYSLSGFMNFDLSGRLQEANPYARALLGIEEGEKNISADELFVLTKDEVSDMQERMLHGEEITTKLRSKRGDVPCFVKMLVARDDNNYPYCMICSVYDYTKEDQLLRQLENANHAKSEFLSNMSHEIRTPIHAVLGLNEMIKRETESLQIREYAQNIESSSRILLSVISDILDVSRIESGTLVLQEEEYAFDVMIRDLRVMFDIRAKEKELKLKVELDETIPKGLYGDVNKFRQILTNLVNNAIKYTDYGSVTLRIKVVGRELGMVTLGASVIDTGKGIRTEDITKLFGAFERVDEKKNRRVEGTGLGLSIANRFAQLMGGELKVSSEYGKGSEFSFTVKQKVTNGLGIGSMQEEFEDKKEDKNKGKLYAPDAHILAVDDNAINLEVLTLLLKDASINVDTALSGELALGMLRERQYDCILLDHMMPGMDGIEVLHTIKKQKLCNCPILAVTANAISGAREMYLAEGFDDYISKPIEPALLEEMLYKWLPAERIRKEVRL